MKCKSCGGELLFQDGIYLCKSCGTTGTLDSIYENIDVCICYEENDVAGRRTKDSIIAQEVYRKLEEKKISTFYERISADGLIGNDLETSKLASIQKAKIIIVLGTSIENFAAIEEKYSAHFSEKPVIPFCVDVNPGAIPKTLSKIQAMSYSTIGWDKDLVKGVCNILGREQLVDTSLLYGRRNTKLVIIGIIAAVVAVAVGITAWIFLKPNDVAKAPNAGVSLTEDSTESTTKPLSQKEIYNKARALLEQGYNIEALELFLQIPEHSNSANMIKQIYSKYEGYYQNETTTIHLEIADNVRTNVEMQTTSQTGITTITATAQIDGANISCTYVDNHKNAGKLELKLENTGLRVIQQQDGAEKAELVFALSEKTDQPVVNIDVELLLGYLDRSTTYSNLKSLGYTLVDGSFNMYKNERYCRIKDTDIYLAFFTQNYEGIKKDEDFILYGVGAPAKTAAMFMIGESGFPMLKANRLYVPGMQYKSHQDGLEYFAFGSEITDMTPIFVTTKVVSDLYYEYEWEHLIETALLTKAIYLMKDQYKLSADTYVYIDWDTVAENDTYYLFSLQTDSMCESDTCIWYKANKSEQTVVFVREGPYYEALMEVGQFGEEGYFAGLKIDKNLWFSVYADFAKEFLGVFG